MNKLCSILRISSFTCNKHLKWIANYLVHGLKFTDSLKTPTVLLFSLLLMHTIPCFADVYPARFRLEIGAVLLADSDIQLAYERQSFDGSGDAESYGATPENGWNCGVVRGPLSPTCIRPVIGFSQYALFFVSDDNQWQPYSNYKVRTVGGVSSAYYANFGDKSVNIYFQGHEFSALLPSLITVNEHLHGRYLPELQEAAHLRKGNFTKMLRLESDGEVLYLLELRYDTSTTYLPYVVGDYELYVDGWENIYSNDYKGDVRIPAVNVSELPAIPLSSNGMVYRYKPNGLSISDGKAYVWYVYDEDGCQPGSLQTDLVSELYDGCYEGCAVKNLSPTESGKWVGTLQGTTTGETCTDRPPPISSDLDTGKMLACGSVGSSDYKTKTQNPIDFSIGNKFFRDTDYRGADSFPIVFGRTYNSLNLGWRFAFTQRIERLAADRMVVRRPGGQSYEFTLNGISWTPDPDVVERLDWQAQANGGAGGWRYTLANNTREFYDSNGRLIAIRNSAGLEQTINYSHDGAMTVTGPEGDTLTVELNDSGLLPTRITDKTGRTTAYTFEGVYLRQVNYPNGTNKQYLYEVPERPWLITGIIDQNGHRSHTVEYDSQGRAIMSELADGAERVEVSYNLDGTTTLTNALGKRTTFHFQTIHGVKKIVHVDGEPTATCQGSAMDYAFDDNGFLTEKTDAEGVTTRFTRDTSGLELSRVEAAGLPEEHTVTTQWDSALRKPLVVTEGNTETRYTYDIEGRTLSRTITDLASGVSRTTRYTYNSQGLLESVDGPREDVADITTYRYDTDGRLSRVTNALGHATDILARDAFGHPTRTRDANGLETILSYDENGRLATRQVGGETTAMAYDAVGNLTDITAPGSVTLHYGYDNANRLIGITDTRGNRIEYTLDDMGNRTSEKVYDVDGQLARRQQKVYDELSRLLRSIGADGQTTSYGYDRNNNLTSTFDPLWRLHENSFDALNRLIVQTDPLGGTTHYGYDVQDRLTTVTDPNGNATTYVYDGLGNLVEQHSPDTGTTTYTHDAAGNVLSKTDAKGQVTSYTYDALNRLTQTTYADSSVVSYTYDTAPNGIGRLANVTDPSGDTAWQYDLHGRTVARIQSILLDGVVTQLTTRWQYNAEGQLIGMTYPSGLQIGYRYANGQISDMTVNGQPLLSAIQYQPFGPINGWTWSNGSQSVRGYDLDGRLISQSLGSAERTLGYDAAGNITAITDPANTQVFGYDALNRLIAANDASFNLAWQYDANGNRLTETHADITTAYGIDPQSNRLLAVGDTLTYQYDANGNLISDGEHSYQYSDQDRLIGVDEGATGEYRYNALGQRIYKRGVAAPCDVNGDGLIDQVDLHLVNGRSGITVTDAEGPGKGQAKGQGQQVACVATQIGASANNGQGQGVENRAQAGSRQILFAYDEYRLLGEYDIQGNALQETVWLGNLPVAAVKSGVVYYIYADHLGTPRVISDGSNKEVWRWDSDPFGMVAANEDPDGDGVLFTNNLRFPGQYYDEETGRHYNYFRDYDPATGRYIESDPIGLAGGLNTYFYAEGNPLIGSDPDGLCRRGYVPMDGNPNACVPTDMVNPDRCATGECGAEVPPTKNDFRSNEQMSCDQCKFSCGISTMFLPGPFIPTSWKELLQFAGSNAAGFTACEIACKDRCDACQK